MSDDLESMQHEDSITTNDSEMESEELGEDSLESELLDDWGGGELEAAYLKALSALEASESEMPPSVQLEHELSSSALPDLPAERHSVPSTEAENPPVVVPPSPSLQETSQQPETSRSDLGSPSSERQQPPSPTSATEPFPVAGIPPTPRQIIEATLFVGGTALTSKRLSGILRGEFDTEFVEHEIDALNRLYAAENRPYEIRLGDGGYRLTLRDEFERIRYKVYGLGPKEVRLSQEALEVLAVVAYHQPIKQSRIEELGKPGCGPVLRQLVRRELIAVERDPAHPRDVNYKTTARFLSLFDIRSLDELPRHEQVSYK